MVLPFTYPSLYILCWTGLVPFLYLLERWKEIDKESFLSIFIAGTLLGIIIISLTSYWLYYPLAEHSGLPLLIAFFLLLLIFILFGSIYGIWALIFVFVKKSKGVSPLWLAISWTAFEYIRFRAISAFPFAFIAYTQSKFLSLLQFAEYGGIFLVGFMVILLNGYLYKVISNKKTRYCLPVFLVLVLVFGVGLYKNYTFKADSLIDVGVVQTNLDPVEKWKVANIESNMDYLLRESESLAEAKLIVWPESSLTFDIIRNEFYRKSFLEKTADIDSYLQIGSLSVIDDSFARYNSSFLIAPGAIIENRYNKMRLVPFGEYIPFSGFVEKLTGISMVSQLPGKEATLFQIDKIKWKTAICSEILYPGLVKNGVEEAQFIVNQSNEAWYRKGNLQEQMWAAARFRAVENRRSILKAGNKAYGGIISPTGSEIMKKHSRELTAFSAELPLSYEKTIYQKWGDYPGFISTVILILFLLFKLILSFI